MTWSARGQVEAGAAGLEREQEDRRLAAPGTAHHRLALADGRAAVEELVRDAGLRQVRLEQPPHRDVLGEDQRSAVLGQHGAEQLVDQVELLRAAAEPDRAGLLQEVRRVVADLLEAGQQREHQAAPGDLVVVAGPLDAGHRVADERLVEDHLLAGQAERVVGLGLGRQLGGDAGVGLAAAQQERADQVGELPGLRLVHARLDRRGPDPAERLPAAEQPGDHPVEDRPELGEVVLHRGAGEGDPHRARDRCAAPWPSTSARS